MKHWIIMLLVSFLIAPIRVEAKKKPFGNGLYWEYIDSGVLIISGNGDMPNLWVYNYPWYKLTNKKGCVNKIIVEEGVRSIGNEAFSCYPKYVSISWALKEVVLPSSLESIGESAFWNNHGLKKIVFGENLKRIERGAFWGCSDLAEIILPDKLEYIGSEAFAKTKGQTPIRKLSIPLSVKSIGYNAFSYISYNGKKEYSNQNDSEVLLIPNYITQKNCENIGLSKTIINKYYSKKKSQEAQNIFEFTFPFMIKIFGQSKSKVKPTRGGGYKLVLDLSAEDSLRASLFRQNGLKETRILSVNKDLNEAQSEMLIDGGIDGLVLEADEDNYKLGIYSKSKDLGYVFDLSDSKPVEANYEHPDSVYKNLSQFFLKMNSKKPVEIKTSEANGLPAYLYEPQHFNMKRIIYCRMVKHGMTLILPFSDTFAINDETGKKIVTFHSRGNQFTVNLPFINDSKNKAIYVVEEEKDLKNWLCHNDVYEITINGTTDEAFIPAAAIKALLEKMK